ncbi:MAG: PilZ domain-containing protein [Deltaproteobacteria bacterium]|nr:PilZ domain-containing protein [Deltaproteobacteria bacterium]
MPQNRVAKRCLKRYTLKHGVEGPSMVGFTEDVSREGLFIKTIHLHPPNTRINIELSVSGDNIVKIEGTVMWAKKVPPSMINYIKKSGMGIKITRIISGEEIYNGLCE